MTKKRIFELEKKNLNSIPEHENIDFVERFVPRGFPFHVAVHVIKDASNHHEYVKPHTHKHSEIILILGDVRFKIKIGSDERIVCSPCALWIPAGTNHATNAIEGNGYLIAVLLSENYETKGSVG